LFWLSPLKSGVLFAPIIIGLVWKGANKQGAYASIIMGFLMAMAHMTGIHIWPERTLFPMLGSTAVLIVVSTIYNKTKKKVILVRILDKNIKEEEKCQLLK